MTNEQEQKLKAHLEAQAGCGQATSQYGGVENCAAQTIAAPPSLRQRISNRRARAEQETRHLDQLQELEYLLDKHPEVARIFELLDATNE